MKLTLADLSILCVALRESIVWRANMVERNEFDSEGHKQLTLASLDVLQQMLDRVLSHNMED